MSLIAQSASSALPVLLPIVAATLTFLVMTLTGNDMTVTKVTKKFIFTSKRAFLTPIIQSVAIMLNISLSLIDTQTFALVQIHLFQYQKQH